MSGENDYPITLDIGIPPWLNFSIVIGIALFFAGFIASIKILLIIGAIIAIISLLISFAFKDYLVFDLHNKCILRNKRFFSNTKIEILYNFTDIKHVKLSDYEYEKSNGEYPSDPYTDFSIHIVFNDGNIILYKNKVTVKREDDRIFTYPIAILRDYAFKIANLIGCEVIYSSKIPFNERKQLPGFQKKLDDINEKYKSKTIGDKKLQEQISDNNNGQNNKLSIMKCYNCNSTDILPGKKFCKDCIKII